MRPCFKEGSTVRYSNQELQGRMGVKRVQTIDKGALRSS